jgi:hypothetical protein
LDFGLDFSTVLSLQVAFKNQKIRPACERSVQEALDLLKDTYASAGERDIMTGDSVEFMVSYFCLCIFFALSVYSLFEDHNSPFLSLSIFSVLIIFPVRSLRPLV